MKNDKKKRIALLPTLLTCLTSIGCAHKSVFPIGDQKNKGHIFQYCGGQQWGFIKKLNAEQDSPYFSIHLESDISDKSDLVILNLAFQAQSNVEFSQPSKGLLIQVDEHEVYNKPLHFGFIRTEKQIWERYSDQYTYRRIENTENDWEVRKKKYNGFFGMMALEEPFVVTINKDHFEEIKSPTTKISYDNSTDAIFIISKVVIPFAGSRPKTSEITIHVPAFRFNGASISDSQYTFHYDRERLVASMNGSNRCASLEEIFRAGRNKDSWTWWMYPIISD